MSAETLAGQAAVSTCLAGLAIGHPNLPAAYITLSQHTPRELGVQLDSPSKLEAWREALGVDVGLVRARRVGEQESLAFDARVYGVDFHVHAVYERDTAEAVAS
ncbi:hypothetical protein ACIO93_31005 [Streptomyces sp. NPDC087903]|uniref:hypothetical protein n=1 Tax=Streptomyces sp. NPDC087903 TaxID=3365819 RepID=UPI0037FF970F